MGIEHENYYIENNPIAKNISNSLSADFT